MRKQLVTGKKLLLFVDTGDNCRCPLAIGYLTKLLSEKGIDYIDMRHMGVMTPNDLLPTPEVVQLLKEEGVDIKYHRSRPVNAELIKAADLVLGFTAIHVQTCLRRVPDSKPKTFLLKDYVGLAHMGDQIHDPMGSTMEIFKKYFSEIKQSLQRLVEMEFITTPPEPKEVVIAPTIAKPRQLQEEDEISVPLVEEDSHKLKSHRKVEAEPEPEKPVEKKVKKKTSASDSDEKPAKKAKKASDTDIADKPKAKKVAADKTGKAKPVAAKASKDTKKVAKPKAEKTAKVTKPKASKTDKADKPAAKAKADKAAKPAKKAAKTAAKPKAKAASKTSKLKK